MKPQKSSFDRAIEYAFAQANGVAELSELPEAVRTVVRVHAAQGVIDNGGLRYLFESDFPGKPPYSDFVDAYRAIGADEASAAFSAAVALFPFANPHRHVAKRNHFLDQFKDDEGDPIDGPFAPLSNRLCGNKDVWRLLRAYVERHLDQLRAK